MRRLTLNWPPESGLSYDEFCDKLVESGFYLDNCDMAWRHRTNGAAASAEAVQDIVELFPIATGVALNILRSGRAFTCELDVDDNVMGCSFRMKVQPLLDQIAEALSE